MATLKTIRMRLKSVKNIQKITKSMKMVSAAKYSRAERDLKVARPYGVGSQVFYEKAEVQSEEGKKPDGEQLIVAISSDRGLCGAIHTNVSKAIKGIMNEGDREKIKLIFVGDKVRMQLQRLFSKNILMHFQELGKKPPVFFDGSFVAQNILNSGYKFDQGVVIYNRFRSVVSYKTSQLPIYSLDTISNAKKISLYDSLDADVLLSYQEFNLASLIYYTMKENATSEQSSRMTAMDSATKNAGEMIDKLTLTFNRTRQAVITRELIEIISGASAL
ncbi:ATP synthase subunit gamma, mitochondrial [Chamberlinius hualienensis]